MQICRVSESYRVSNILTEHNSRNHRAPVAIEQIFVQGISVKLLFSYGVSDVSAIGCKSDNIRGGSKSTEYPNKLP